MSFEPSPERLYRCPECEQTLRGWRATDYAFCEDCGSHPGMTCPNEDCMWTIDLVFNEIEDFEVADDTQS